MRTPTWESAPGALLDLLRTSRRTAQGHLVTLRLTDGTIYRWTDWPSDLAVNGKTFRAPCPVQGHASGLVLSVTGVAPGEVSLLLAVAAGVAPDFSVPDGWFYTYEYATSPDGLGAEWLNTTTTTATVTGLAPGTYYFRAWIQAPVEAGGVRIGPSNVVSAVVEEPVVVYPPSSGPHLHWRAYVDEAQGPSYLVSCAELEMRTERGGANVCTGGVYSASNYYGLSYRAQYAFDGNAATEWIGPTSGARWIGYSFAAPQDILEIAWRLPSAATLTTSGPGANTPTGQTAPKVLRLQYSDDGSAWGDAWTATDTAAWALGEQRIYPVGS